MAGAAVERNDGLAWADGHREPPALPCGTAEHDPAELAREAGIQLLLEAGLLRASFVPPKPIRTLRNLTRYRKTQINDRQREAARLHKILEDTGIKLGVRRDRHPRQVRPGHARRARRRHDRPERARRTRAWAAAQDRSPRCARRSSAASRTVVGQILAHLDFLDEAIDRLSAEI